MTTTPTLQKRLPAIVTEPAQDDYSLRYIIRYRQNWRKLQPEQQAAILYRETKDYELVRLLLDHDDLSTTVGYIGAMQEPIDNYSQALQSALGF